ncbi:MAG: polyprenyl synthetase family protein [Gemmatimonadaceae bacterium]
MTTDTNPSLDALLASDRRAVEDALVACCRDRLAGLPPTVSAAVAYALLGGGKRLRAALVCSAYRAAGGRAEPGALAAAVEVVHAYSLVHDDLPCMDDDDMRRGRSTVHRVHGVPAATAAGLAMVPLAAVSAYDAAIALGLPEAEAGEVVRTLMIASGAAGMIGGQLLDLEGEGHALSLDQLERIHRCKTGALITAAVRLGGLVARAGDDALDAFSRYGQAIGLAFQIADDVLDLTATSDELGKTVGRDVALGKSTYPALLGIDGARDRARALVSEACEALAEHDLLTPELQAVARFTVDRRS